MRGRAGDSSEEQRVGGGASGGRRLSHGIPSSAASKHDRMRRALVLLVAGVWLALAGIAISGVAVRVSAAPFAADTGTPATDTPTTAVTDTPTPTDTPHPTRTPRGSPTPSVTASTTATGTPTTAPPTATTSNNGGGGGSGDGNGGDIGPQPTKVVSQLPSAGNDGSGPLGGLSAGAFGSNGLLLATTSSCIVGLLGLLIAAIALAVLIQGGYGPFLKALLRGKRTGEQHDKHAAKGDLAAVGAHSASDRNRSGRGAERDERGGWSDPRGGRGDGSARQGGGAPSRSRSRGANHGGW